MVIAALAACSASEEQSENAKSDTQNEPTTDAELIEQVTFTDLQGNAIPISQYEGKVVMIDFWETWCKPCLASFPTLQRLQEEYPDNFVVLAVTPGFTDTKEDAQSFMNKNDYTFEFLMDSNNLHKKLNVMGIPYKIFVDAEGNFIKQQRGSFGPDEDYKKIKSIIEKHKKS
jgi:thiol-disulfide isomerase/thioredoxin